MKKLKSLCLILCMCVTVFAGEKGLSRSQAAKILKKEFAKQGALYEAEDGVIFMSLARRYTIPESSGNWNLGALRALSEAGLINFQYIEKSKKFSGKHVVVVGPVTDEGMKYVVIGQRSDGSAYLAFKLADKTLVRITGILNDSNSALVEYEWKYANITPFGHILTKHSNGFTYFDSIKISEEIEKDNRRFLRYDDGWRMK